MKNLPRTKRQISERAHLRISQHLLSLGKFLEKRESRYLSDLQFLASRYEANIAQSNEGLREPGGLNLQFDLLIYSDLYTVDEIDSVRSGIKKMKSKFSPSKGSLSYAFDREREIDEWLNSTKKGELSIGSRDAGYLFFEDKSNRYCPFKDASLILKQISSSFVALIIVAIPSDSFKSRFEALLNEPSGIDFKVHLTSVGLWHQLRKRRVFLGHSERSASAVKQLELNFLTFEANAFLTQELRKSVGVGLNVLGPLPSFEVLSIAPQLDFLPENAEKARQETNKSHSRFFSWIGYRINLVDPYEYEWLRFYHADRRLPVAMETAQMLVSRLDFATAHTVSENVEFARELRSRLRHSLQHYVALFAIQVLADHLLVGINRTSYTLGPKLATIGGRGRGIRTIKSGVRRLRELNEIISRAERLWVDVFDSGDIRFTTRWTTGAKRKRRRGDGEGVNKIDFLDDWEKRIQANRSRITPQMKMLRASFDALLQLKHLQFQARTQRLILFVSVIAVGFGVLSLIEGGDEWLNQLWSRFFNG